MEDTTMKTLERRVKRGDKTVAKATVKTTKVVGFDPEVSEGRQLQETLITPALAHEILGTAKYDDQRTLREGKVDQYAEAMRRGEFELDTIKIACYDGKRYLINGQHRLHAIVKANLPIAQFLLEYDAPSLEAVHKAYQRTDIGAARNIRDLIRTMDDLKALGLNASETALIGTAALHILSGFRGVSIGTTLSTYERSETMRLRGIEHWAEEGLAFYEATRASAPLFRNGAVLAVGLVTFRYAEAQASLFWKQVAENNCLVPKTGPWHLLRLLQAKQRGQGANTYSKKVASCWNAFIAGVEFKGPMVKNPDASIEIRGTPYKGHGAVDFKYE
jgi:hypothetical protein